ncbi:MAG TPA: GIY-YIG nuclease family protein [Fibrobacteraceae bacterium]|nr:GIY-YIG nuclease family protein [Fibrobacteraceae bacterium]
MIRHDQAEGHFVYMLRCRGNRLYTGYAVNVEQRYRKHCAGLAAHFTRAFPPEELLGAVAMPDRSTALRLEAAIKKLDRQGKEQLIPFLRVGNAKALISILPF